MNNLAQLNTNAELAFAAYSNLKIGDNNEADFRTNDNRDMPLALATSLATRYRVISILNDPLSGAYAAVFEDKATGARTLAIRGTSQLTDVLADAHLLVGIPAQLNLQYQALAGKAAQWRAAGLINAATALTGHSLGGYLATALKSSDPGGYGETYTYNAPGLGTVLGSMAQFFKTTFGLNALAGGVYDIRAAQGLSFIAGLGEHWGAPVPVEIEPAAGAGLANHSIGRLSQALALHATFDRLQPGLGLGNISQLIAGTGQAARRQEEALDTLRTVFMGPTSNDSTKTPTDDREAFYKNLDELQKSALYKAAVSQVQIKATASDFASSAQAANDTALAYRYALRELLALGVVGATDAQNAALYGSHKSSLSLYDPKTGQGELTEAWLQDRAAMLWALVRYNKTNSSGGLITGPGGQAQTVYQDLASNQTLKEGNNNLPKRFIKFGGAQADTLLGEILGDHLFGGAGADTLSGQMGADYLEGGADADKLDGGADSDTLLGGAGADTLTGGSGADLLLGGLDSDSYVFAQAWGHDVIEDADGQGSITLKGEILTGAGAVKVFEGAWHNADTKTSYTLTGETLTITQAGSKTDSIAIRNWSSSKSLGLTLPSSVVAPTPAAQTLIGDFIKQFMAEFPDIYKRELINGAPNYVGAGLSQDAPDEIAANQSVFASAA
jgi:hypothetical protein